MSSSALLALRMMPSGPTRCSATAPFSKKSSRSVSLPLLLPMLPRLLRARNGFGGASARAGPGVTIVSVILPPEVQWAQTRIVPFGSHGGSECRCLMPHAGHDLPVIDLRIWSALDRQYAEQATLGP